MRWRWSIALVVLSGCAFIDPVWEFRTSADPRPDAGQDQMGAGANDGGSGEDAEVVDDAGPTGWNACRPCTVGTDEGCPDGFGCYVRNVGLPDACSVCVERTGLNGTLGEECSTGPDCEAGLDCMFGHCRSFCAEQLDCGGEVACIGPAPAADYGWCIGADCDPTDQATCPEGMGCALVSGHLPDARFGAVCTPVGSTPPGESCAMEPCEAGAACVGLSNPPVCARHCRDDEGCDETERCLGIGTVGGELFGVCMARCAADAECEAEWRCDLDNQICVRD